MLHREWNPVNPATAQNCLKKSGFCLALYEEKELDSHLLAEWTFLYEWTRLFNIFLNIDVEENPVDEITNKMYNR